MPRDVHQPNLLTQRRRLVSNGANGALRQGVDAAQPARAAVSGIVRVKCSQIRCPILNADVYCSQRRCPLRRARQHAKEAARPGRKRKILDSELSSHYDCTRKDHAFPVSERFQHDSKYFFVERFDVLVGNAAR